MSSARCGGGQLLRQGVGLRQGWLFGAFGENDGAGHGEDV